MKKLLVALVATIAAMGVHATGSWEQFHGTSGNNGRAEKGPDLRTYKTPRFASAVDGISGMMGTSASGPVVADGRVFCYAAEGWVMAFDEASGALLWKAPVAPDLGMDSSSSPSVSDGKVFVGSGNFAYCLDAATGSTNWVYEMTVVGGGLGQVVNPSVTIAEDLGLCFLHTWGADWSGDGVSRLHAICVADGTTAWTLDIEGNGQGNVSYNPDLKLVYTTVGASVGGWSGNRGGIAAVDAVAGSIAWTSVGSFESKSNGGVAFDAGLGWVVAAAGTGSDDYSGVLVCNATNGLTVSYTGDGMAPAGNFTPTIAEDGTIYVCGAQFSFYDEAPTVAAIDGFTGNVKWMTDMFDCIGNWAVSTAYAKDIGDGTKVVYCASGEWLGGWIGPVPWYDPQYAMIDAADGEILYSLPMEGGNAALANGNLYFINDSAKLVAFGPKVHIVEAGKNADGEGTILPSMRQGVAEGESVLFTFVGEVRDVFVNGVSIGATNEYKFANVATDNTIDVIFRAQSGWEQFHGNNGNNGRAATGPDLRIHGTPRFEVDVEEVFGFSFDPSAAGPVVMDGKVFVYSDSGFMQAFDETTGGLVWKTPVSAFSYGSWSSPSASAGKVYMGAGDTVYCFDANNDGAILWEYVLTGPDVEEDVEVYGDVVNASVTIAEDIGLCFMHTYGSFGGGTRIHAIHTADGTKAWTLDVEGQGQGHVAYNPAKQWIYTTTSAGGSYGIGFITAVDATDGTQLWTSADHFDSPSYGGIAFDAKLNWVVAAGYSFGGKSGLLICDASDGSTVLYTGDKSILDGDYTPTIGEDGTIYVASGFFNQQTIAIDGNAPSFNGYLWESDYGFGNWCASLVYAQDISDGTGALYAPYDYGDWENYGYGMLCPKTGDTLAIVPKGGGNAALANGNLYFVTEDSKLVAYGPWKHSVEVVDATSYGKITPTDFNTMKDGESVTFSFTEREVADVLVNGVSVGAVSSYTFANVKGANTLKVVFKPSVFATSLVQELTKGPYHSTNARFRNPAAVLGKPVTISGEVLATQQFTSVTNSAGLPRAHTMFYPAFTYSSSQSEYLDTPRNQTPAAIWGDPGCTVSVGGAQIVVTFDEDIVADPRNPFGIDFIVHGNSMFVVASSGSGAHTATSDHSLIRINASGAPGPSEKVVVSVAQYPEGPWHRYESPYADNYYPTQPFSWINTAPKGWGPEQDWTKPVDPSLTNTDFANKLFLEAMALYDGSAGGTGYSLAETPFEWIRYVKVDSSDGTSGISPGDKAGEICGFARVAPYLGTYPVTVNAIGNGTFSIQSGDFQSGQKLTVKAIPDPGWEFSHWEKVPYKATPGGDSVTVTVNRKMEFEAVFVENPAHAYHDDYEGWLVHYEFDPTPSGKDYVDYYDTWLIGLDPHDADARFVLYIEMDGDEPLFHWAPNLGSVRHYTLVGKERLTDEGEWEGADEDSRFFRVRVKLPDSTEENWMPAGDGSGNVRIKRNNP